MCIDSQHALVKWGLAYDLVELFTLYKRIMIVLCTYLYVLTCIGLYALVFLVLICILYVMVCMSLYRMYQCVLE